MTSDNLDESENIIFTNQSFNYGLQKKMEIINVLESINNNNSVENKKKTCKNVF